MSGIYPARFLLKVPAMPSRLCQSPRQRTSKPGNRKVECVQMLIKQPPVFSQQGGPYQAGRVQFPVKLVGEHVVLAPLPFP